MEVIAVVTQPDKPSGRHQKITFSPVKEEALRAGIEVLQPHKLKEPGFFETLKRMEPDFIVVVAYGRILPGEIIHLPKYGCINLHASLLPKYRGAAPINHALIHGDKVTGITSMLMDEGLDTGPMLLTRKIPVSKEDTAGTLTEKLACEAGEILMPTLKGLAEGTLKPVVQHGQTSYAPVLQKADCCIDWSMPAGEIECKIRGLCPNPGTYCFFKGMRIKIMRAEALQGLGKPGFVTTVTKDKLLIGTGLGLLSIVELQPQGKSAMLIRAFLQGHKIEEGMWFSEGNE